MTSYMSGLMHGVELQAASQIFNLYIGSESSDEKVSEIYDKACEFSFEFSKK